VVEALNNNGIALTQHTHHSAPDNSAQTTR
jgi:hypothetical protein